MKIQKSLSTEALSIITCISVIGVMLILLLLNYLYYVPKVHKNPNIFKGAFLTGFIITIIVICVSLLILFFLIKKVLQKTFLDKHENLSVATGVGAVGSFVGSLGVGSFAVTMALLDAVDSVPDVKQLPGTMNIGQTIPVLIGGMGVIAAVPIDILTLVCFGAAVMVGAYIGAIFATRVSRKAIILIAVIALIISAILMLLIQLNIIQASANAYGVKGWRLAVGMILFVIIGSSQAFGIGMTAPAIAVIAMLGMNIMVAFAVSGICAGLSMPITSLTFYKSKNFSPKVAFGFTIGGVMGGLLTYLIMFVIVQGAFGFNPDEFSKWMKWIGIFVILYAAYTLTRKYMVMRKQELKVKEEGYVKPKPVNYFENLNTTAIETIKTQMNLIASVDRDNLKALKQEIIDKNISYLKW